MTKFIPAAGLALALISGPAFASDLLDHKALPPAPMAPPAPAATWNGLYAGVNIGYGFGNDDLQRGSLAYPGAGLGALWDDRTNINGVLGGGQIGYNYELSPWLVLGVEADIQGSDVNSQTTQADPAFRLVVNQSKNLDWFGTVRGRVGVTLPSLPMLLVYGAGGFAYGQVDHNLSVASAGPTGAGYSGIANSSETATGWTAGGGVEWIPPGFQAWSLKAEYLYTDLGSTTLNAIGAAASANPAGASFSAQQSSPTRLHTVRAGLNWRFNPFVAAPAFVKF